jgi:hypothetical protein
MDENNLFYKNKYLKYKTKYLQLLNNLKISNNIQSGGAIINVFGTAKPTNINKYTI